jgi:hypothetical protein
MARQANTPAQKFASSIKRIEREISEYSGTPLDHDARNAEFFKILRKVDRAYKIGWENGIEGASGEYDRVRNLLTAANEACGTAYRVQLDERIATARDAERARNANVSGWDRELAAMRRARL